MKRFFYKLTAVGAVLLMVVAVATATAQTDSTRLDDLEARVAVLEGFHDIQPEPEQVVPDTPDVVPATCDAESSLTVPDDTDVLDYEGPFASTGTVSVTVELMDREQYVLELSGTGWVLTNDGMATFSDETDPPLDCDPEPEDIATWEGVVESSGTQPTITIDDSVYPNADGVQFLVNDEIDDRCGCRPNGYDATGPQDNSTFHIYPDIELVPGDTVTAKWESGGVAYEDSETVPGAEPEPTEPEPTEDPTEPEPEPPTGDRPNATTTGPTDTEALVSEGSFEIETDGAVVENVDVSGRIRVEASNVTIRNFRVDAGGALYGIQVNPGLSNVVIEDGEVTDADSAGVYCQSACTLRRLHIHDHDSDGMKLDGSNGPTLVEDSYITRLGQGEGSHADGMQSVGGEDMTFRGNNFYMPYPGTDAHDEQEGGPFRSNATFIIHDGTDNILIEDNWLNGGNYTVYGNLGTTVRNNVIGPDYRFGFCNGPFDDWSGNVFEDGTAAGGPSCESG